MLTSADKRAAFRKLHESGCFIIPNPHDAGSARALQHLGFKALASTSAGFAWTIARADNKVTVDDVCNHLSAICAAVDIPVNADFEDGFAHEPDKVGVNVARAVKTGVAGLSIEDFTGDNAKPLFERALAIDRIRAARKAIDADNSGVLLTGRCEAFLRGQKDLAERTYALSMNGLRPTPETRTRLAKLVGGEPQADAAIAKSKAELDRLSTIDLGKATETANADFFVLLSGGAGDCTIPLRTRRSTGELLLVSCRHQ